VVDGDIERMDELLKVMTEFAGFDQPRKNSVALKEYLHSTLKAIHDDCAKRQVRVGWKGNGQGVKIMADAAQLQYALKNTMLAVLSQTQMGSEIELALGKRGSLTISYLRALLTSCASRLTPVEKVLFRPTNGAISQAIRGAREASVSLLSAATPGRIETDGSCTAKGILARYRRFVRSRGEPEVGLDRRRNLSSPSSVARAGAGDWDVHFRSRVGFRALHGAGSGSRWSVRQRTAGAPRGATPRREKRRGAG
jgi:hypothetical protein